MVEDNRNQEEEPEEDELYAETREKDSLSKFGFALLCHHSTSSRLNEECEDIPNNKDLRYSGGANH